jgi:MFS family permease
LGFSLGAALLAIGIPIPVVMSLYFGGARLGAEGYVIVGATLFVLLLTSGTVAAVLAGWLVDRHAPEGRRPFAILMIVLAVVHLAGIIAIIFVVARAGANAGIAVSLIVPVVLFTVATSWGGELVGRRDAERAARVPLSAVLSATAPRTNMRRVLWIMLAAFVVVAAVGLAIVLTASTFVEVVDATPSENVAFLVTACLWPVAFAFFAADVVALVFLLVVAGQLKSLFQGSYLTQKRLYRLVVKGRGEPLDTESLPIAARYAELQILNLSLNLATLLSLYGAIATEQVSSLIDMGFEDLEPFALGLLVMLVLVAALAIPLTMRNVRRIQRYLAANPA